MEKKLSVSFYLDCFTSSSQSFSIPFVDGVGPQIKCSQCNKGQLQRTAETEENGSKRIRKWTDSCSEAPHSRVLFWDGEVCFVQQPSNTADCAASATITGFLNRKKWLSVRDDDALSVHAGAASSEDQKIIFMDFSANQRAGGGCLTLKTWWNAHQSKLMPSVHLRRAIGWCVEDPQDGDKPECAVNPPLRAGGCLQLSREDETVFLCLMRSNLLRLGQQH